ncbi:probable G-protein coupled receptor Mth-like 5 isoform X2 [Bombyx mandarina]|uniref:Probable G-protein coupled receptor Mth-like 5 isoform X1 n=1 Tax=Bombyx mandarina TaxID=7092 RepID=A0A6J2K6W4_BOMMA|nr:probable G-protein coupled receptor Mth-like 5 isoform X1 [Bombyx mandarina]XP_028036703.1 probable G-protein coupled receptor Mth-like 5 isoform X2 [Bombyx mandarina]
MYLLIVFTLLVLSPKTMHAKVADSDLNEISERQYAVRINKCCEHNEIMVDFVCRLAVNYNQSVWEPHFKTEDGQDGKVKYYNYTYGLPDCEATQWRPILDFGDSEDKLNLLTDGRLRHLIYHKHIADSMKEDIQYSGTFSLHGNIPIPVENEPSSYIHMQNKYCMDKISMNKENTTVLGLYAHVCIPDVKANWKYFSFLMKRVMNPAFHAIAIIIYLIVAIIYFVLPTLRDLSGNMITTINLCLIISQAAGLVRIFTEFSNHISFMITDIVLYISLLAAFFWLNSFGFYIWKTFKSRNVFLRVTDVRKYCYYSSVVWLCVAVMTAMAMCAHFLLDIGTNTDRKTMQSSSSIYVDDAEQETIGLLGIAIFFTPVAFTILFNMFFYITTLKIIKRINIYGRIHYKLKGCFTLFLQLFVIMTTAWLFLLLSWLNFDELLYAHIFVNLLQAILIFYVCILRQPHVTFLLRKSCCYAEPVPTGEWGDEMTHMNGGNYDNY